MTWGLDIEEQRYSSLSPRHADNRRPSHDITNNDGSGTDDSPRADLYSREDQGARSQKCAFADPDAASAVNTWYEMGVGADVTIVVYRARSIQDDVRSNTTVRVHHRLRQHHCAVAERGATRDRSVRMLNHDHLSTVPPERVIQRLSSHIIANGEHQSVQAVSWPG